VKPPGRPYRVQEGWILLVGAIELLLVLGEPDIYGPHEARVAATAREMTEGGDLIVPSMNGKPRLVKPPLAYWLAAAAMQVTGSASSASARLPAALCGILALLALMDLGRRWLGPAGGAACGMVWVGTFFIAGEYRKAMADPYLACAVVVAVRQWAAHLEASRDGSRSQAVLEMVLFGLAAGAGALAKGPLVLVHLAIALVPYHVIARRRAPSLPSMGLGAAVFLAVALPWPAAVLAREPGALSLWMSESVGQVASERNPRPAWYYLPQLLYVALFWTPFLVDAAWALGVRGDERDRRRALWPLAWIAGTILFFSFPAMKKNTYLLPMTPALALATGAGLVQVLEGRARTAQAVLLRIQAGLACAALPVLLGAILGRGAIPGAPWILAGLGALLVPELVSALATGSARLESRPRAMLGPVALALALLVHLETAWLQPLREEPRSPVMFARAVLGAAGEETLHAVEGVNEALLFHLGRRVETWRTLADIPLGFSGYALLRPGEIEGLGRPGETVVIDGSADVPEAARLRLVRLGTGVRP